MIQRMIKKLLLVYRTASFLKPSQIFFQLKLRVQPSKTLANYIVPSAKPGSTHLLAFRNAPQNKNYFQNSYTFTFLNLTVGFKHNINWNFQGNGKLWNYNLQYFDFLHQEDLPVSVKIKYLHDIANWLNDGRLKLEPYPVSLRIMNTSRFLSANKISDEKISQDLFAQVNYLSSHLEYHLLGNHLLENAFALFMGGYLFHNAEWKKQGKGLIYRELEEQVLADGAHFELSPMYHQVILFRVLELIDWYGQIENPDLAFLDFIKEKAKRMLAWLRNITFKNGDIPHFNDSTAGIAHSTNELFQFANTLDLETTAGLDLQQSGYHKYELNGYECIIDTGEPSPSYQPGHSHADALSFILYKSAKPFIIEVGTSTYEAGERRDYERSTKAHNTVVVKGQNQSQVWGSFRVGRRASVQIIDKSSTELTARHNGYLKSFGVYHTRKFNFYDNRIEITDIIDNATGIFHLHFHPGCEVVIGENSVLTVKEIATLQFDNASGISLVEYHWADGFNKYRKAMKAEVVFISELKTSIKFL